VNHSRAGALASSFSKFKHKIVEGRATEDLKNLLGQTRLTLHVVLNNSSPSFGFHEDFVMSDKECGRGLRPRPHSGPQDDLASHLILIG